jgi:hypothetical protein
VKPRAVDGEAMLIEKPLKSGRIGTALTERTPRGIAHDGWDPIRAGDGQNAGFFEELARRATNEGLFVGRLPIGSVNSASEKGDEAAEHFELARAPDDEEFQRGIGCRPSSASNQRHDRRQSGGGHHRRWPFPKWVLAHPRLDEADAMGSHPVYHTAHAEPPTHAQGRFGLDRIFVALPNV